MMNTTAKAFRHPRLRAAKGWIAALLLLSLSLVPTTVLPESPKPTAAVSQVDVQASQIIRVWLQSLGIGSRLDITLDGVYSLGNQGEASMIFQRGTQLTFQLQGENLIVYYEGMSWNAGTSVYLTRYAAEEGAENGIRFTEGGTLYEGDLNLTASTGVIRAILHIHLENYLYGLVPYEMSDSFPLEALKVQAVAARTYAMGRADSSRSYDVLDTADDQVFRGRNFAYTAAEQAVNETRGLCGFYQGKLAQCYYSASNGGQTAQTSQVWGGADLPYLAISEDPYDVENPASVVRRHVLPKAPAVAEDLGAAFSKLLIEAMADALAKEGFSTAYEDVRIDEIMQVEAIHPKYEEPSRLMTTLSITFRYAGIKKSTEGSNPEGEASAFVAAEEPLTLELPIFPDVKYALGLTINSTANELVTVVEEDGYFVVEARRFGHGVGMSQRGAEWMAGKYGKTFDEILAFYYPGMALGQLPEKDNVLPVLDPERLSTPGPAPTPTPRPTLMPVFGDLPQGAWYATVYNIEDDSSLNLRADPNIGGELLMRLYKHQRLIVLGPSEEAGWVHVKTDVIEGYVMEEFLKKEE